ncbi:MAG: nitrous oxide reductase accessory protein NosL, partial [Rhodanobacter sp.]
VHRDDTCAVCGMSLDGSPGPRAQAWVEGRAQPLMFDSTRDFFAYVLQPENQSALRELFVQDSAQLDWQQPTHVASSFIDARQASYVAWQPLPGSMGPTLAPFATPMAAQSFVSEHGGAILGFGDITPNLVATLEYRCPAQAPAGQGAQQCLAPAMPSNGLPAKSSSPLAPITRMQPAHSHP